MESQPPSNIQMYPKRSLSGLYEGPLKRPRRLPPMESTNLDSIGSSTTIQGQISPPNPSSSSSPIDNVVGSRVAISSLLSLRPTNEQPYIGSVLPGVRDLIKNNIPGQESSDVSTSAILSTSALTSLPFPTGTTTIPQVAHIDKRRDMYTQRQTQQGTTTTKQKVIPCPYEFCQKTFSRNSNLKVHLRIHTKTYPFACNLCEREFMWSSSLHWHTKWHEKVAMREQAKLKGSKTVRPWSAAGNTRIMDACTCKCLCPVHDKKNDDQKSSKAL